MCEPIWMQLIGADGTRVEWSGADGYREIAFEDKEGCNNAK
jgi:hypothetical protein